MNIILSLLVLISFILIGLLYYRFCKKTADDVLAMFKKNDEKGGEKYR
jgi:hypothetical protein